MSRRYLRPGVLIGHVLVLAASLTCLRLGWWQWDVFQEARGTVQNLGYALLWPVFAGSFIYMWLRFLQLEETRIAAPAESGAPTAGGMPADPVDGPRAPVPGVDDGAAGAGSLPLDMVPGGDDAPGPIGSRTGLVRDRRHPRPASAGRDAYTVGMGFIDDVTDDDDPELAAYNRALAALAEQDERRDR